MKKLYALFAALLFVSAVDAQDCSGNRYYDQVFNSTTSILDVKYGENLLQDGTTVQELFMDIYMPQGDIDTDRPVILMAHGGSFIQGTRQDLAGLCQNFAKQGYVAITMSYRLLQIDFNLLATIGLEFQKEVVRAMHDMKAAIRFLHQSVEESNNPYGINPNIIIVGGYSAGAILANHTAYLNLESEIPTELVSYVTQQGGLEGNSGNAGYPSNPQMVISLCGAIKDTTWMNAGDIPYVGVHNQTDAIVPNISGQPNVMISIPVTLYGDSSMYKRALNQHIASRYMMVPTTGHCDFPDVETFAFVRNFTHDQLCVQGLSISKTDKILYSVYPNPSRESISIDIPSNQWNNDILIYDILGNLVHRFTMVAGQNIANVDISGYTQGIYTIKLESTGGKSTVKRFVKL